MRDFWRRAWRRSRKLVPWIYFGVLTVFMTWPLVRYGGSHVFGNLGDNFYFLWQVRWWEGAVQRLPVSPFSVPGLNYPEGWNLAYNEIPLTQVVQALPVSFLFGTTAGFNFSVWMSFFLSGLGAYLLVRRLTRSRAAALLAGTIFAFAPYRFGHMMGHFNLMGTQWFPFYFLALYETLVRFAQKRPVGRWLAGSAVFLGLIGFTSQYYLYMTLVLTAVFFLGFLIWGAETETRKRVSFYLQLAATGALLGAVAFVCALPFLSLSGQTALPTRSTAEMDFWSPSIAEFFIPSPFHFLLRDWVSRHFDRLLWVENNLYLGFLPLALAVLVFIVRKKIPGDRKKIAFFAFLFLCAFVLTLGTRLKIAPGPTHPELAATLTMKGVPLPGAVLVRVLPFYGLMRVFSRYGIFAVLFLSVLAGFGARWILNRIRSEKKAVVLAAFFAFFIAFEFKHTRLPLVKVEGRPVDHWLAERHEPGAVVQFPATEMGKPEQVFYTSVHKKPFVGAFFAAAPSPQWLRISPALMRFPNRESVALFKELKVRYVLVDSSLYSDFDRVRQEIEKLDLAFLARSGDVFIYAPR